MDSRSLNSRIVIQQRSTAQDEIGQPVQTWTNLVAVWANIKHLTGFESIQANAEASFVKASVRIRRRTDVTSAMRVVFDDKVYEIRAVLPDERTRVHIDLLCELINA